MGKVVISNNLRKTADRLTPDGNLVNLETPSEEPKEPTKEEKVAALEAELAALKEEK